MKILYITSYPLEYSSSANMRNIALIKGLLELGHSVSTLSSNIEKDSTYYDDSLLNVGLEKRYWIEIGQLHSKFTNKNVKVSKINNLKKQIINKMYKIYAKFRIYDSRKYLAKKVTDLDIKEKFDLIISSSDPKSSHIIAEKLIKSNPEIAKRWIQYWGDPFANDINKNTLIPTFLIKKEERRIISKCDKVVYVSPFTLDKQKELYKEDKNKMIFVPIPYIKEKIYKITNNEEYTIGYFGDYNSKDRDIMPLYEAVKCLNLNLKICGNSNLILQQTDKIDVLSRQPQKVIEQLESEIDLLVVVCNRCGTQIPGKVYHYAATNKPILVLLDGSEKEQKQLFKYFDSFKRYEICNNIKEEVENKINELVEKKVQYEPLKELCPVEIAKKIIRK